jgi:hypothetical protein
MAVVHGLFGLAVRQLIDGTCAAAGLKEGRDAVVGFLSRHFTDHSKKLTGSGRGSGASTPNWCFPGCLPWRNPRG